MLKTKKLYRLMAGLLAALMICVSVPAVAFAEGDETGEGVLDTAKIEEENCEYTVTQKDTKMILIEDSNTSMDNSDILNLDAAQIEKVRSLA